MKYESNGTQEKSRDKSLSTLLNSRQRSYVTKRCTYTGM